MSRFLNDNTKSIKPYIPGEQPKGLELIKLNTNENPYPPAPSVINRIKELADDNIRLYPDPEASAVKKAVAGYYGIDQNQIFVGNGSDEVLGFLYKAFFNTTDQIAYPDITYSFYPVYSELFSIPSLRIPVRDDFTIDFSVYPSGLKAILVANPNAPTGIFVPVDTIEALAQTRKDTLIIVDEAYVDFGGSSAVPLINRYDNVLVVQTLSKSRSLAGMRIGLAIGCPDLIAGLEQVKNSFNSYTVDRLAQGAAASAFDNKDYFDETREKIMNTRNWFQAELEKLGVRITPSSANFVFACIPGIKGGDALQKLREQGILVRNFQSPRIEDWLRITIGTDQDMEKVIFCIKSIMQDSDKQ